MSHQGLVGIPEWLRMASAGVPLEAASWEWVHVSPMELESPKDMPTSPSCPSVMSS